MFEHDPYLSITSPALAAGSATVLPVVRGISFSISLIVVRVDFTVFMTGTARVEREKNMVRTRGTAKRVERGDILRIWSVSVVKNSGRKSAEEAGSN